VLACCSNDGDDEVDDEFEQTLDDGLNVAYVIKLLKESLFNCLSMFSCIELGK
jgi:hypothetical protein